MDLDSIKRAFASGNITFLNGFINNEAILQKFVNGDPQEFYEILSSAMNVNRDRLNLDNVDKIYDDLILQLIRAVKEVHFRFFNGRTLLRALRNHLSYEIIIELLKAGSDVNAATNGMTPLIFALQEGIGMKIIAELINRGADINCRNPDGWTPLFYGMFYHYDRPDFIQMLLDAGSNVHDLDVVGANVLMIVDCYCINGSDCKAKESIDALLKHGLSDLDFKHSDNQGNTVLHRTCCKYVFELAMKSGVSIESKNNRGRTPFLSNLNGDSKERLFYLLKCGANIHSSDLELHTLLHVYILHNYKVRPSTLDMLIYHGGNMFARDISNHTPLDIIIGTHQFRSDVNAFSTVAGFISYELIYVIPKHIILFYDNGFDIARKALENVNNISVSSFLSACKEELDVMRETFIKDGLTFYEFCILKRYYKSKCVNIAPNEFKYSFDDISKRFPLYKNIIIIRIKDNRRKKRDLDFRRVFERIVFCPVNTMEIDYNEILNYDCLYHISKYLNFKEMFNTFSAAIEI